MKKKKLFLLASLATALAMTSCSSFDEPAALDGDGMPLTRSGENSHPVYSEADLRDALEFGETDITIASDINLTQALEINDSVSISGTAGKKITSSAPIICKASAIFSNLTIDATTPKGSGVINLEAENIVVELDGVNITQHTEGTTDDSNYEGLGIKNVTCNNKLTLKNTDITMTANKYVRAINMYTQANTDVELELDNCHITCGNVAGSPSVYARVLSFSGGVGTKDGKPVTIKNSTLEGAYYVVNSNGSRKVEVNVIGGTMDGRAAFNIWSKNFIASIDGTTLIGRNNYAGPTETFATIVLNKNNDLAATGSNFTIKDVTFKMFAKQTGSENTNIQYAISYRASDQTLNVGGTITVIDQEQQVLPAYVVANYGVTNIDVNVEDGTTFNLNQANTKNFF